MILSISKFIIYGAAACMLVCAPSASADISHNPLTDTIDLSPGGDVYAPRELDLNHATHRLYVTGFPAESTRNAALKVIDSTSNMVVTGVDLGRYSGQSNGFQPLGIAVDESAAPLGNKIYLFGKAVDASVTGYLRVIDGSTNTNLTGENSDVVLPVTTNGADSFSTMTANAANHKVYIAKSNGEIVVVDGPSRQILKVLNPNAGDFVIASPAANKIFVVNHNGGAVINSADDSFTQLLLFFFAKDAAVNPANGRIYFVGVAPNSDNALYAVDGATGQIVGSRTDLANVRSVAVDPSANRVYVGSTTGIAAFDATDLSSKEVFAQPAVQLACDPQSASPLFLLEDPASSRLQNIVGALKPATGELTQIATGYRPFDLAVNNRSNRIYVTDQQTPQILVLDGSTHAILDRIPMNPSVPRGTNLESPQVAVSERLNRFYFTPPFFGPQEVVQVFDGSDDHLRSSIPIAYDVGSIAVDDSRRRLYVGVQHTGAIPFKSTSEDFLFVYDLDTEALVSTISLGTGLAPGFAFPSCLSVNSVTGRVYATIGATIKVVDADTNSVIASIDVGGLNAVNRKINKIYAASRVPVGPNANGNGISVINGETNSVETAFAYPNEAQTSSDGPVAVDEVTNTVFFGNRAPISSSSPSPSPSPAGLVAAFDANQNYQSLGQALVGFPPRRLAFNYATRQLFVTHDLDGIVSVLQNDTPTPPDLFANISTRALVGPGDNALIGGFVVAGSPGSTKKVIIRAIGPSLAQFGVANALSDPTLELHDGNGSVITNDNWKINDATHGSQQAQIEATGLAPSNDSESAILTTVTAGQAVTAIVRGKTTTSGAALVEVYDLETGAPVKLANISTRGQTLSGDNVMIAGVIMSGSKAADVVLRALGPSLVNAGVPGPLQDPVLELRDPNGGVIASNDDWQEHEAEVNAKMLAPTDPRESAIVATLYPGSYTAIIRGKNGAVGVGLIEAYFLGN